MIKYPLNLTFTFAFLDYMDSQKWFLTRISGEQQGKFWPPGHPVSSIVASLRAWLSWKNKHEEMIWAASWQNQQNGMCAQRRMRSAWASAQSDRSLHCQPGHLPSLIGVFAVRMKKPWVLIPSKTSRSVSSIPWITPEIRRKIRRKNKTHAKAKKTGSSKLRSKFETLRREIKADVRKQHDLYVNNLVGDVKANPRDFYRYINSQKKDTQGIPPLKRKNGKGVAQSDLEKAEEFNGQFMDVFSKN